MTMTWSTVWDLPAPLGRVRVTEATIRHIFTRHMTGAEPWDTVLLASLLDRLRKCWTAPADERSAVLDEIAPVLEEAVRQAILRPLFISYDQQDERRGYLHTTYEVIAPTGFVALIRQGAGQAELKTVFFPDEVWKERPARRWLGTVKSRIKLYGVAVGDLKVFTLPGPADAMPFKDPPGFRINVVFHNPKAWGFREVQFPNQESPLTIWSHPLPWPGRADAGGAMTAPHQLKKPRRGRGKS